MATSYRDLAHANSFDTLMQANRDARMRRSEEVIRIRELVLERQAVIRHSDAWWQNGYVRDFATTFATVFVGAMVFLA
jgi:hypothetical protein